MLAFSPRVKWIGTSRGRQAKWSIYFPLHASYFSFLDSYLLTFQFLFRISDFKLHFRRISLLNVKSTFHTCWFSFVNSFSVLTSHFTLLSSNFTLRNARLSPLDSIFILHTLHFSPLNRKWTLLAFYFLNSNFTLHISSHLNASLHTCRLALPFLSSLYPLLHFTFSFLTSCLPNSVPNFPLPTSHFLRCVEVSLIQGYLRYSN